MKVRTAFILGAGLGTRLRPLTEKCPKPLLPVGGRPLITYAMDHCLSIGVSRFIVNTHHCAEEYDRTFPKRFWRETPILFRHEPVLLDTAGGIKNIEDLLTQEDETILVYNGDILSDLPLSRLLDSHTEAGCEVTLALRSDGPLRNVSLDTNDAVCDFRDLLGNPGVRRCLFTGICVVERRFLHRLTPGKPESTIPLFASMIRESPGSVASVVIDDGIWEDIGDPEAYERISEATPALRCEGAARTAGGNAPIDARPLAASSGAGEKSCRFTRPVTVSQTEAAISLPAISGLPLGGADSSARSKTLEPEDAADAATVPESVQQGAAPEESTFVLRALGLAAGARVELLPVGKGGSDRSYFRVSAAAGRQAILMRYGRMYEENDLYAGVANFLGGIGVTVPAIYGHDPEMRLIIMEDLGDRDLYSLRDAPWEIRSGLYKKTLSLAAKMHAFIVPASEHDKFFHAGLDPASSTGLDSRWSLPSRKRGRADVYCYRNNNLEHPTTELRLMPGFDADLYRWERNYFREECVRNVCCITLGTAEDEDLEAELSALAGKLLSTPPALVHRDLQSQNVMIRGGEPVLIDFQGLRSGSIFYDLASLLYDPYVRFPDEGREGLLRYYLSASASPYPFETFQELFLLASAQRLMQALGAYGFLGLKREKPHFLAHIRPALDNLVEITAEAGSLPRLHALARRCRDAAEKREL